MPMFQGASGVTVSGGRFNDVTGDMVINDSSSHTENHGSFNTTNETHDFSRNDYSRNNTHTFHAGTVNNYNGAKNVNTGANYGTINQNDHRGAMPSREPYPPQSYYYQQSRDQGFRPPNYPAYSSPPAGYYQQSWDQGPRPPNRPAHSAPSAGYYYDEQEYYHNYDHRSPYGRPRGAPQYQDHPRYRRPPQGSYQYPVGPRDEEIRREEAHPGDDVFNSIYDGDEGEESNPHGTHPPSAEANTPASHPRNKSDVVASAASTSDASLQSGPPVNSKNPFRKS